MLAICPNSPEVWIYTGCHDPSPANWVKAHVLAEHDLVVSGMDWSPVHNKIVTCSHDRNAFVWTLDAAADKWNPTIAVLRLERAALDVKWSPDGRKFAVASGDKCVPICYYEAESNWWVCKHIKKHRSTILSVAWHPNSQIVATACCDFKCRILSAILAETSDVAHPGPFAAPLPFGELYAELGDVSGWVEDVAFSPSGSQVAFVSHDCVLTVAHLSADGCEAQGVAVRDLPYTRLLFLSERCIVAAGHGLRPTIYSIDPSTGAWGLSSVLDSAERSVEVKAGKSNFSAARDLFAAKTKLGAGAGAGSGAGASDDITTKHHGAIMYAWAARSAGPVTTLFSTSGVDGRVVTWPLEDLGVDLRAAGLA